jgi:hypothetical protein
MTKELIYGKEKIPLSKGHVEEGGSFIEMAMCECLEETGIPIDK